MGGIASAAGTFNDDEGVIEGTAAEGRNPPANNLYCPSDPVIWDQMAAFLVRALGPTDDGQVGITSLSPRE